MKQVRWKNWFSRHSDQVLEKVGVGRNCVVLDFGCGSGTHAIPAARLASAGGKVYALDRNGIILKRLEGAARRDGLRNIETILFRRVKP